MSRRTCRLLLAAALVAVGGTLLAAAPASAGQPTVGVQMVDNHYLPSTAGVAQGQQVEFSNFGQVAHDARDRSGLDLFDTGFLSSSGEATVGPLPGAGEYRYYCTFHPEMLGRLRVPVTADRGQVPAGSPVTIRWATTRAPTGMVFDVQRRLPGARRFVDWRVDATAGATRWWPSVHGTWAIRARVRDAGGTDASDWSPVRTVRVT